MVGGAERPWGVVGGAERPWGVVGGAERPWGVVIGACLVSGSLDRCVGGVAADIILEHSQSPPSASEGEEPTALRVVNLHPLPSDPVIQVSQDVYVSCLMTSVIPQ